LDVTVPAGDHSVTLDVRANAVGNNFAVSGIENSPIAVYVNDLHHSDLFVMSERTRSYNVNLADLPAGTHRVELRDARDLTGGGGALPEITSARQQVLAGLDALVARHAPVVEARWTPAFAAGAPAEQTHSDVPLLQIAVVEPADHGLRRLRYYLLSSNEDTSGFPFGTIMRKFGRTADYELMYEAWVDDAGKLAHSKFQGPMHIRRPFEGERMGERPVLRVATRNGLFSSQSFGLTPRWSEAPVARYAETPTDREVMAADPWSFTLMGKENLREGRTAARGTIPRDNTIAYDAREHLYFEASDPARKTMEAARSVTAHMADGSRVTFPVPKEDFRPPPHGLPPRTTAIALPPNVPSGQITALDLPPGTVFTLDDDFKVRHIPLSDTRRGREALVMPDAAPVAAPRHARHEIGNNQAVTASSPTARYS
ncbi:MAG: hypothetical protein H7123_09325, partial [Thermoleophilia bacterium]|nr:hypothetical protein [Thermoleophilia bacterium]